MGVHFSSVSFGCFQSTMTAPFAFATSRNGHPHGSLSGVSVFEACHRHWDCFSCRLTAAPTLAHWRKLPGMTVRVESGDGCGSLPRKTRAHASAYSYPSRQATGKGHDVGLRRQRAFLSAERGRLCWFRCDCCSRWEVGWSWQHLLRKSRRCRRRNRKRGGCRRIFPAEHELRRITDGMDRYRCSRRRWWT